MKTIAKPYFLLLTLVLFLASCSKKSNVPVPADAMMVVHIDGSSLQSKLSWEEFKQGELYKIAMEEIKDDFHKKILANPDSSGIDIGSDAFLFIRTRGRGAYTGFTCKIKDEKAFTAFVSHMAEGKEIMKDGDLSVIKTRDAVLSWKDNRFVMIGDSPGFNNNDNGIGFKRKMDNFNSRSFPEDSLVKFAAEVYTIKGSSSIGDDSRFTSLLKEPGDAHIWFNSGKQFADALGPMIALTKAGLLLEGNITAATMNFEKGKVVFDAKSYINKEMAALYKKHSGQNLDEDMLKKIPSGNINAVLAVKYVPQGLKDLLILLGLDGAANSFLSKINYSVDEFVKANKGDLLFAVTDFSIGEKEIKNTIDGEDYSFSRKAPSAKFLFATSVNDKVAFQKLVTTLQEKLGEESPAVMAMAAKVPYRLTDNWFLAGDSAMINTFGATSTNHAFISKISGHPMGGYVDIQKFIGGIRASLDSASVPVADSAIKFWQDIVFYGGEFKNDAVQSHFEFNLADQNTSSLKQLNNYLGGLAKAQREMMKRRQQEAFGEWQDNTLPTPDTIR